jgi:hypothetical protein
MLARGTARSGWGLLSLNSDAIRLENAAGLGKQLRVATSLLCQSAGGHRSSRRNCVASRWASATTTCSVKINGINGAASAVPLQFGVKFVRLPLFEAFLVLPRSLRC